MIKIHVIQTGTVCVDIGVPLEQKNPLAKTGWFRSAKNRVTLPVTAYLIEHPKGLILIDTGWSPFQIKENVKRVLGFLPISYGVMKREQAVDKQIEALGYKTSDIDCVYLTHMDSDHAGGLSLVKDAKSIKISEEENKAIKNPFLFFRYEKSTWKDVKIDTFAFSNTGIGPFGRSYDVFGDGTVTLVSTRGHSLGLFTTIVKSDDEFVAIIGDTGYMEKSWKELILPGLTADKKSAELSLKWVQELSKDKCCKEILATHDPAIKPHTIEI